MEQYWSYSVSTRGDVALHASWAETARARLKASCGNGARIWPVLKAPLMKPELFAHPFSSYYQKVLIALHENDTAFSLRLLTPEDEHTAAEFARLSPLKKFPLLRDGERVLLESSVIIEYLMRHHPGPVCMLPSDPDASFV